MNFFDLGHCRIPWLLFVCLFALMPSRRKKSGYPFILEFFTRLSWYWCQHPLPGPGVPELNQPWWILGTEAIFLPLRLVQLEHHITAVCWYHWCKEPSRLDLHLPLKEHGSSHPLNQFYYVLLSGVVQTLRIAPSPSIILLERYFKIPI